MTAEEECGNGVPFNPEEDTCCGELGYEQVVPKDEARKVQLPEEAAKDVNVLR